jgi:hypothetical protein
MKHTPERINEMKVKYPKGVYIPVDERVDRYTDMSYGKKW